VIVLPLVLNCSQAPQSREITIIGTDYLFTVPASVKLGLTAFSFENRGRERHEMSLVRLKSGITVDSVLSVHRGPNRRALMDVNTGGILFADAGQRTVDQLLVRLAPGRTYLLICNLRDAPDQPEHTALGMFAGFTVDE
jgi:hypothetical protein